MAENIYNFNKKSFLIGFSRSLKRILIRATLELGRITKLKQDSSREFILILAYISTIRKQILLLLIYKGKSGDLITIQVDKVTTNLKVYFTVSYNGQLSYIIRLVWFQKVFKRYTKPLQETQKRLLIVNRHSSYINIVFINQANKHNIILLILPLYTTY